MTIKGMLSLFTSTNGSHRHHSRRPSAAPPSPGRQTFSASLMEENISSAEPIITKWDPNSSSSYPKITSLFNQDRDEARLFLRSVSELQQAMVFFVSDDYASPESRSQNLILGQTLMQAAVRRLEKEFYQILSSNRDRLDPESITRSRSSRSSLSDDGSSEDEIRSAGESISEVQRASAVAMDDLHSIAETMITAGYGRECVRIYKVIRKSIVDESLYCLGFETVAPSQMQKLDWEVLDLKIQSWLGTARVAVRTLFSGERILCDYVFAGSDSIRESCFAEIARDAAVQFLGFPESVTRSKRSPEKLFRILDLYDAFTDLWPDIESVFSFDSTSAVRSQALASLLKIAEVARGTIADFEAAIQKDASKSPVAGGAVHPLTRYVMNYIVFLTDYEVALADIFADFPLQVPPSLAESFFDASVVTAAADDSAPSSPSSVSFEGSPLGGSISVRIAWLVLVLLCKMDGKAESYREVALSYLFLANNLQYVVNKVRQSRLRLLLGDEWVARHRSKARHYASSYERLAWAKVVAAIPADPAAELTAAAAWERMRGFSSAFDEACSAQAEWVVADERLREEVRASVADMIVPAYRGFYERFRALLRDTAAVKFAPEDVRSCLSELFSGSTGSGSGSSSGSSKVLSRLDNYPVQF